MPRRLLSIASLLIVAFGLIHPLLSLATFLFLAATTGHGASQLSMILVNISFACKLMTASVAAASIGGIALLTLPRAKEDTKSSPTTA